MWETGLKRDEALAVLKELLDGCAGLDGHSLELTPPNSPTSTAGGYQIIIRNPLDQETKNCILAILSRRELSYQLGSMWKTRRSISQEPDTLIIYKPSR